MSAVTVAGAGQQFTACPPPPPLPPAPPLQLPYIDHTVPHFTQIPQMFHLYYHGVYRHVCTVQTTLIHVSVRLSDGWLWRAAE